MPHHKGLCKWRSLTEALRIRTRHNRSGLAQSLFARKETTRPSDNRRCGGRKSLSGSQPGFVEMGYDDDDDDYDYESPNKRPVSMGNCLLVVVDARAKSTSQI